MSGQCQICGSKVRSNKIKYCSLDCVTKNYKVNEIGCWEWQGSLTAWGYPQVNRKGKIYLLHRYFYEKFKGKILNDYCVLHTCDNRKCINPLHLFLGTRTDNARDKVSKGRCKGSQGEMHPKAVLNENKIHKIRKMRQKGFSYKKISQKFGTSDQNIADICLRKTWKHI